MFTTITDIVETRRIHRRIEAMLMHPLRHHVIHPVNVPIIEQARDSLRELLGYSESVSMALGQQSIDEEVEIRLSADGHYVFRLQATYNGELD